MEIVFDVNVINLEKKNKSDADFPYAKDFL